MVINIEILLLLLLLTGGCRIQNCEDVGRIYGHCCVIPHLLQLLRDTIFILQNKIRHIKCYYSFMFSLDNYYTHSINKNIIMPKKKPKEQQKIFL